MNDEPLATGVVLTQVERNIVNDFANRKGLGSRNFSAALRMIIREWAANNQEAEQDAIDRDAADARAERRPL